MTRIIAILTIIIGLTSCQPKERVYVKHLELSPDIEWLKKDIKEFKVPIEDDSISYNLSLSFRYAHGYQFKVVKVKVTETSPSGNKTTNNYDVQVRDEQGNYIGEPGYDIWDSEHLIEANKKYKETGTYTYTIEQNMPVDPLNLAMEIGVILDIAKEL